MPNGEVTEGFVGLSNAVFATPRNASLLDVPDGISVSDLDTSALLADQVQSGRRGGIVFVAWPLTSRARGTPVLLLTDAFENDPTSQARGFFLLAAVVSVGLAILVAAYVARRLTKPLAAMGDTARSVAAGDLAARVDLDGQPDDELADLARTLNAMAAQLEHARGMERAFILSVSHDLRTPLTSIRGYAEAMTDGAISTDAEQARAAHVIESEARRLERLVAISWTSPGSTPASSRSRRAPSTRPRPCAPRSTRSARPPPSSASRRGSRVRAPCRPTRIRTGSRRSSRTSWRTR